MNVTAQLLIDAVGCTPDRAYLFATHLDDACDSYAINTPERAALFFAHAGHESESLSKLSESLNYGADRLVAVFGAHRITQEQANKYGRKPGQQANQEAIANIVYGGDWGRINLGNVSPGDGWKYRARGIGGITGLANYQAATGRLVAKFNGSVPNFVDEPEALEQPRWAAISFADFWNSRGLNALADLGTEEAFRESCRLINGGFNGIDDRRQRWERAKRVLAAYTSAERVETTSQIVHETPEMQGYQALEDAAAGDPVEYPQPEQSTMPTLNDVLQSPLTKLVLASANPILAVVPEIAKIFMDKGTPVPERNVAAAVRLVETAQQALQKAGIDAPNAQAAAEAVTSNPQAREAVRAAVLSDPYWHSVEVGGGVVAAAARNDELISRHDWRALAYNPAVWFTAAILPLVYMTVGEVLRGSGWSGEIKASVVSAIVSGVLFGMTGYWLGTSASSQRKTDIMGGKNG